MPRSRDKGKRGELEVVHEFAKYGILAERTAPMQAGGVASGYGDVRIIQPELPYHVEVKRVERLNIHRAMEQAIADAPEGMTPVVIFRRNRGEWMTTMRLEDWVDDMQTIDGALRDGR